MSINLVQDAETTVHNLTDLLTGKTDFNGFVAGEVALYKKDVAQLPSTAQAFVGAAVKDLETTASGLVGVGKTVLGPIIAAKTDDQATMILNVLSAAGVPTGGAALSPAEHAALDAVIDGFKATATSIGIRIATQGVSTAAADAPAQPAQPVQTVEPPPVVVLSPPVAQEG